MIMDIYAHVLPGMRLNSINSLHDQPDEGVSSGEVEL
jgi:hypothetical protein